MVKRRLNIDVERRMQELRTVTKDFEFRKKIYSTLLRGKSLEFDGFREYSPSSDDASNIDWKASARTGQTLVRKYRDESNQKILFILDVGDNMVFGSQEKLKCEYAAEIVAAFSNLVMNEGDLAGLLIYSSHTNEFIPPGKGKNHLYSLINVISNPENYEGYSDPNIVLKFLIESGLKNISSIVWVSDFIKYKKERHYDNLNLISNKFEILAIMIKDPIDKTFPEISEEIIVEDPETKEQMLIDPSVAKHRYEFISKQQEDTVINDFRNIGVDLLILTTDKPFVPSLAQFLKERVRGYKSGIKI